MVEKEKYIIKIQGDLTEVSENVYCAYFRMERRERWQKEKSRNMMWCPMMRWTPYHVPAFLF